MYITHVLKSECGVLHLFLLQPHTFAGRHFFQTHKLFVEKIYPSIYPSNYPSTACLVPLDSMFLCQSWSLELAYFDLHSTAELTFLTSLLLSVSLSFHKKPSDHCWFVASTLLLSIVCYISLTNTVLFTSNMFLYLFFFLNYFHYSP